MEGRFCTDRRHVPLLSRHRSRLSVLALGLEKLHFSNENRRVNFCTMRLGRLKDTLFASAVLLIGLPEAHEVCVMLDDLTGEAALGWDRGD